MNPNLLMPSDITDIADPDPTSNHRILNGDKRATKVYAADNTITLITLIRYAKHLGKHQQASTKLDARPLGRE
jgi:hypothetical protein